MADNLGLIIQVNYADSQRNIDNALIKLQEYVSKKKLHIAFDTESLKGLEQISKSVSSSIGQVNNLNSSMQNLGRTMQNVNKQSVVETKQNGILTEIKEIKELETELGKLIKITEVINAKTGSRQISEETVNYKKQREAIDALNASKMKMQQSLEPFKLNPALATEVEQLSQKINRLDMSNVSKTNVQEIRNQITTLGQLATEIERVRKEEERLAKEQLRQQEQAERNLQRQQQLYAGLFNQTERTIQQQARLLNTRMQSALGLGNNISNNLTPESSRVLEHQLERYRNIIRQFQANNEVGITIRPEQLTQLQNLENRIRRFYETVRQGQNDSHGFNFTQYEQFTRLNPAITNATHAQQYYNTSLLEGHRLIAANIQETQQYIRVTQQLRNGSQHLNLGVYIDRATGQMYQFNEALRDGMTRSWGLGEAISTAATKAMVWSVVMGTMYSFLNILQQIPQAIISINTRLVEMSKVMSSDTDFGTLMKETAQTANDFGRTITEAQDSLVEFGKQGYEAAQSIEMANTALLGANVTGLKAGEMAGYLTATMAQFNIAAEDSVSIVNKINEVDNNFAVTSVGLAQSLSKAGESAQQYGATLDNLIGYTTAIQTATKESGSVIGNSLKSSISRTFSEDSEKALAKIGIAIRDISGEYRTVDQIWKDLSIKFKTLSTEQRNSTALTISGRFHLTRFLALMDNWDIATKATTTSQQSLFSALEENRKHLASLESQINKVKSAGQEFAYVVGENGLGAAMYGVLGVTTTFIKGLTELASLSTTAKTVITAFSLTLVILAVKVTNITNAIFKLSLAMKALALSNPWLAVIAGLTTATVAVAGYLGHQKQLREEQEKLTQTIDKSTEAFNELKTSMDEVGKPTLQNINDAEAQIRKYDELITKIKEAEEAGKGQGQYKRNDEGVLVKSDLPFDPSKLSDEMKDLSTNLGINILQIKTWGEFVEEAKKKQDELNGSLENGKKNSTEYQAEQIKNAQSQLDLANNTKQLVDEYQELLAVNDKNEAQNKRLAEVKRMLMSMFPEEFQNQGNIIQLIKEEAIERVKLAESTAGASRQQLEENRKSTQSAYETAIKNIALYKSEIDYLQQLWSARANNTNTSSGDFQVLDNLSVAEFKLGETTDQANLLADTLNQIDDVLNWKPAPVTSSGGSGSSKSSSSSAKAEAQTKSLTDALLTQIDAEQELQKAKSDLISKEIEKTKSEKDYQGTLTKTTELIASQTKELELLNNARDRINSLKDSALSSVSSQFGDINRWFTGNDNQESVDYINEYNNASSDQQKQMESTFNVLQKLRNAWVENNTEVVTLTDSLNETKSSLQSISYDIVTEQLSSFTDSISHTNSQLEISKAKLSLLSDTSSEYSKELIYQNQAYEDLIDSQRLYITYAQSALENDNLSIEAKDELRQKIQETTLSQLQYQKAVQDNTKELATKVVEAQKELAQKELDSEEKALNAYIERKQSKIDGLQEEIDLLEKKNDEENESEERQKRLLAIEEARQKLTNVQNERNTRILVGDEWQWVANPNDVADAQKSLKSLEEEYIQWEEDIDLKHKKSSLEAEIQHQQDLIDTKQKAFEKEKELFDEQWKNIDTLSTQLLEKYGTNIDSAVSILSEKLVSLNAELSALVDKSISLPNSLSKLSNGSSGSSGGSSRTNNTGNSSLGSYLSDYEERVKERQYNNDGSAYTDYDKDGKVIGGGIAGTEDLDSNGGIILVKKKYHNGGWVGEDSKNLKSDEIPAILQKGEFVLSKDMLANLPKLDILSNIPIPKMPDFSKINTSSSTTNNNGITIQNLTVNAKSANDLVAQLQSLSRLTNVQYSS